MNVVHRDLEAIHFGRSCSIHYYLQSETVLETILRPPAAKQLQENDFMLAQGNSPRWL